MVGIPRPELRDAARAWLGDSPQGAATARLRAGLEDFLANRYAGAADHLKQVHAIRRRYFGDDRTVSSLNDGTPGPWDEGTLDAAASASAPVEQGRLLFQLVRAFHPDRVLELGTNIGISACYLGLGLRYGSCGRLITVEASGARLQLARQILDEVGLTDVEAIEGYFDQVLPDLLDRLGTVELAFLDGNHQLDATMRYFHLLRPHMPSGSLMILDDIRWSEDMLDAWGRVSSSPEVSAVADLGRTGLLVMG